MLRSDRISYWIVLFIILISYNKFEFYEHDNISMDSISQILRKYYRMPLKLIDIREVFDISTSITKLSKSSQFGRERECYVFIATVAVMICYCAQAVRQLYTGDLLSSCCSKHTMLMEYNVISVVPDISAIVTSGYLVLPKQYLNDLSVRVPGLDNLGENHYINEIAILVSKLAHKDLVNTVIQFYYEVYVASFGALRARQ
jgi:hypothetical protein